MEMRESLEEDELLRRVVGRRVIAARRVVCGRPYAQDIVLELEGGVVVSFCGKWDEDTVIREGDHAVGRERERSNE